jgi:HTH-type transcriptional regulator / antitoxin HigA
MLSGVRRLRALGRLRGPNTVKGNRLEVLVTLVEVYEQKHHRIDPPNPIEAITFRMEQLELKPSDLADILGGRSRVSEILNNKGN